MQQEVEAELKVPFREDDLVDIVSDPAGEVLAADGVVVSISPDGGTFTYTHTHTHTLYVDMLTHMHTYTCTHRCTHIYTLSQTRTSSSPC